MVATISTGINHVALPEDVRRDLGLEDGIDYVMEQTDDGVLLRPADTSARLTYPPLDDVPSEDQLRAMSQVDRLFGSLARYRTGPVLSRAEEREAFERGVAAENSSASGSGDR
jgi:bifunctional DNA-binding transcriptional regulator/antitoxin component of YhaV-PrlF toxin-antitoxin module